MSNKLSYMETEYGIIPIDYSQVNYNEGRDYSIDENDYWNNDEEYYQRRTELVLLSIIDIERDALSWAMRIKEEFGVSHFDEKFWNQYFWGFNPPDFLKGVSFPKPEKLRDPIDPNLLSKLL